VGAAHRREQTGARSKTIGAGLNLRMIEEMLEIQI
jgi:hypothetical protein